MTSKQERIQETVTADITLCLQGVPGLPGYATSCLVCPQTATGREWITDKVNPEPYQMLGDNLFVEARYLEDLVAGMQSDGLIVKA